MKKIATANAASPAGSPAQEVQEPRIQGANADPAEQPERRVQDAHEERETRQPELERDLQVLLCAMKTLVRLRGGRRWPRRP